MKNDQTFSADSCRKSLSRISFFFFLTSFELEDGQSNCRIFWINFYDNPKIERISSFLASKAKKIDFFFFLVSLGRHRLIVKVNSRYHGNISN